MSIAVVHRSCHYIVDAASLVARQILMANEFFRLYIVSEELLSDRVIVGGDKMTGLGYCQVGQEIVVTV